MGCAMVAERRWTNSAGADRLARRMSSGSESLHPMSFFNYRQSADADAEI